MTQTTPQDFRGKLLAWRKEQDQDLRSDDGWLCVVGLVWLKEGENRLKGPLADAGALRLDAGTVLWTPANGPARTLRPDTADRVTVGSVTFQILRRGARTGVRIRDTRSEARRRFQGRRWFAPDPAWQIRATFVPYPAGHTMPITNVLGDTQPVSCPGYATFTVAGSACRLDAQGTAEGLFFNFRDRTSGKGTYPAGRFLDTDKPVDGTVILDFNRAVSPPCAFTEHATCPLPPPGNILAVEVPAGERYSHG